MPWKCCGRWTRHPQSWSLLVPFMTAINSLRGAYIVRKWWLKIIWNLPCGWHRNRAVLARKCWAKREGSDEKDGTVIESDFPSLMSRQDLSARGRGNQGPILSTNILRLLGVLWSAIWTQGKYQYGTAQETNCGHANSSFSSAYPSTGFEPLSRPRLPLFGSP